MSNDFDWIAHTTPTDVEKYEFMLNNSIRDFICRIPFVELGDTSKRETIKLRTQIDIENQINPVRDVFFELQHMLYIYKKRYPKENVQKLIISRISVTPDICTPFSPRRGLMLGVYYE